MRRGLTAVLVLAAMVALGRYMLPEDRECHYSSWWSRGWKGRLLLELRAGEGSNLAGFPYAIRLSGSPALFWDNVREDGQDVRFVTCDGQELPFDLEVFDFSARELFAWVRLPMLGGSEGEDRFYLYHGNQAATRRQDGASAWDGFGLVFHGSPSIQRATALNDSVSAATDVRLTNDAVPIFEPGVAGRALALDGTNALSFAPDPALTLGAGDWTIELWVRFTEVNQARPLEILSYRSSDDAGDDVSLNLFRHPYGMLTVELRSAGKLIADQSFYSIKPYLWNWTHLALIRKGGTLELVANGDSEVASLTPPTIPLPDVSGPVFIGSGPYGSTAMLVDEIRISPHVARSHAWMAMVRHTMLGGFHASGPHEWRE
jgi:hypothetical protein